MSGLEALGIACNIFQVVSFGREVIQLTKHVYDNGTLDDSLAERSVVLENVSSAIQKTDIRGTGKKTDKDLLRTAQKCEAISRSLREEIAFLLGNSAKGNLVNTLKVAAKTTWRKRRLDRLEKELSDVEKLMQSGLLTRICDKVTSLERDVSIGNKDLAKFIQQYNLGHRDAKNLIIDQGETTRAHTSAEAEKLKKDISREARQANDSLTKHLTSTIEASTRKTTEELERLVADDNRQFKGQVLLTSLKYPRMNERRNDVKDAFPETFSWLFAEDHLDHERQWDWFTDWLRSDGKFYWIAGKPGSGKTTLVKFILSHDMTSKLLNNWRPNPLVISHFFWRPGSSMQQSIKGMLCSLLHQLFAASDKTLKFIRHDVFNIDTKESDTDWSTDELLRVMKQVIRVYERPICIFLDGLDEVLPADGVVELLSIVAQLGVCGEMKICLSSRPEPLLLNRLRCHPQLHIHDLTLPDLQLYASQRLGSSLRDTILNSMSHHVLSYYEEIALRRDAGYTIRLLVERSEGVFLWLCLAIKDVVRGIELGDGISDIIRRIEYLPDELANLYEDMFSRMDKDLIVHRETTARLFRLTMAGDLFYLDSDVGGPTIFDLMLTSTSVAERLLQDDGCSLTPDELLNQCRMVQNHLITRCGGLLDIKDSGWTHSSERMQVHSENYKELIPYADVRYQVKFIHRTAFDFLYDTAKGKEILSHDTENLTDVFLVRNLASCKVFKTPPFETSHILDYKSLQATRYLLSIVRLHSKRNKWLHTGPHRDTRRTYIERIRRLNKTGWIKDALANDGSKSCSEAEFYQLCADACLFDYLEDGINHDYLDSSAKTRLLCFLARDIGFKLGTEEETLQYQLWTLVLKRGADINGKPSLFPSGDSLYCTLETPLGVIVNRISEKYGFKPLSVSDIKASYSFFYLAWKRIHSLIKAGASLETRLCRIIVPCSTEVYWLNGLDEMNSLKGYVRDALGIAFVMLPIHSLLLNYLEATLRVLQGTKSHSNFHLLESFTELQELLAEIQISNVDTTCLTSVIAPYWGDNPKGFAESTYREVSDTNYSTDLALNALRFLQNRGDQASRIAFESSFTSCYSNSHPSKGSVINKLQELGITCQTKGEIDGRTRWSMEYSY